MYTVTSVSPSSRDRFASVGLSLALIVGFGTLGCQKDSVNGTGEPLNRGSAADSAAAVTIDPDPIPDPDPVVVNPIADDGRNYFAVCGGKVMNLADIVRPIAEDLTAQKIPYGRNREVSAELRDCSGNFLRLSSRVAEACPDAAPHLAAPAGVTTYTPGGNNVFPHPVKARDTRDTARWYHEQGRFTPVFYDGTTAISDAPADLAAVRDRVRPGAVLWFSRSKPMRAGGTDPLWNGGAGKINHMGTVTEVETKDGIVVRYSMYHGHGKDGTPADITHIHYWDWPDRYTDGGAKPYPPFGYWDQYLVGIGTLLPTTPPAVR